MEAGGSSSPNPLGRSIGVVLGNKNRIEAYQNFILHI